MALRSRSTLARRLLGLGITATVLGIGLGLKDHLLASPLTVGGLLLSTYGLHRFGRDGRAELAELAEPDEHEGADD